MVIELLFKNNKLSQFTIRLCVFYESRVTYIEVSGLIIHLTHVSFTICKKRNAKKIFTKVNLSMDSLPSYVFLFYNDKIKINVKL